MAKIGKINVQTPNGPVALPIYSLGDVAYNPVRVQTPSGVGALKLVDPASLPENFLRVNTASGVYAVEPQLNRTVTIDENSGSTLSNYPLKITLTAGDPAYSEASAGGADIRFHDGTNYCNHFIETWNTAGTSTIWVKVPTIPANGTVVLDFLYGDGQNVIASNPFNTLPLWDKGEIGTQPTDNGWTHTSNGGVWYNTYNTRLVTDGSYGGCIGTSNSSGYSSSSWNRLYRTVNFDYVDEIHVDLETRWASRCYCYIRIGGTNYWSATSQAYTANFNDVVLNTSSLSGNLTFEFYQDSTTTNYDYQFAWDGLTTVNNMANKPTVTLS